MNLLMKFSVLGISLMLSVWACANDNLPEHAKAERCDHQEPETFFVEVILDRRNPEAKPDVKPKAIVACFQDTIEFAWQTGSAREEFDIEFDEQNAYMEDLESSHGVAKGNVKADPGTLPSKKPVFLKYWVKVTGRPDLDPRIIITPR